MAFFAIHSMALGKKHSTEHALIDIVNQIQPLFDKGMLSCGVFIDFKKAFDTTDYCILLQKLYHYGIRGIINDRFHSYLTDRDQSTQIGSEVSTKFTTACGVPQGSVLGPLLGTLSTDDGDGDVGTERKDWGENAVVARILNIKHLPNLQR